MIVILDYKNNKHKQKKKYFRLVKPYSTYMKLK